jgi:hypothetical protein
MKSAWVLKLEIVEKSAKCSVLTLILLRRVVSEIAGIAIPRFWEGAFDHRWVNAFKVKCSVAAVATDKFPITTTSSTVVVVVILNHQLVVRLKADHEEHKC